MTGNGAVLLAPAFARGVMKRVSFFIFKKSCECNRVHQHVVFVLQACSVCLSLCQCHYRFLLVSVCVCVCVCACARACVRACVSACVRACVRERERETDRQTDRQRQRQKQRDRDREEYYVIQL